mgnify:FL=1
MTANKDTDIPVIDDSAETPVTVRLAGPEDLVAITKAHQRALGPGRYALTAYRVREGTPPLSQFCHVAESGKDILAAVRFTPVSIGGRSGALLLGPVAVDPNHLNQGLGQAVINAGIARARESGAQLVVLVGDSTYYGRLGFAPVPPGQIRFPGPVNPARILAMEFVEGALGGFKGEIRASDGLI